MKTIANILGDVQQLFGFYSDYEKYFYEEPTSEHILLMNIFKMIQIEELELPVWMGGKGSPLLSRKKIYKCYIAKSILQIVSVTKLINRLKSDRILKRICGYNYEDKIPSESTFSRAFAEYADSNIGQINHKIIIKKHLDNKIIGHISRDSTAINSREKPINKKKDVVKKIKRKRGRPKKGEIIEPKELSVKEKQLFQSPEDAISELTLEAAWGAKLNSQGNKSVWKGYKLHLDVTDFGLPVSAVLTGANVHDSQVAIPLEKTTETRCDFLYSLMDSAYDAGPIYEYIKSKGRVPIIDENKRRGTKIGFDPAKKERFKIRSVVERCNAHLKDWLLNGVIYVKGYQKVQQHLMFSVIILTAIKILQYLE